MYLSEATLCCFHNLKLVEFIMSRNIKTTYWNKPVASHENEVRTNSSSNANRAVAACIMHMQVNDYGAMLAEVWDDDTGELHAVIKRRINGDIHILYKRDPMDYIPVE
jgi:hypothetical protein